MSGEEFLAAADGAEDVETLAVAYVLIEDGEISPRRVVAKKFPFVSSAWMSPAIESFCCR